VILSISDIDPDKLVIVKCRPAIQFDRLLAETKRIAGRWHALQLFSADSIMSREHLAWAYANALNVVMEKSEIASTLSLEVLLFAAMSKQIDESISKVGAIEGKDIVAFAENKKIFGLISKYLKDIKEFCPAGSDSDSAAHKLGLAKYDVGLMKSAMTLSRI
jgi:tRNA threonylcarbamoyladenosine modification (KEOPS) complex Cgi121 subunit